MYAIENIFFCLFVFKKMNIKQASERVMLSAFILRRKLSSKLAQKSSSGLTLFKTPLIFTFKLNIGISSHIRYIHLIVCQFGTQNYSIFSFCGAHQIPNYNKIILFDTKIRLSLALLCTPRLYSSCSLWGRGAGRECRGMKQHETGRLDQMAFQIQFNFGEFGLKENYPVSAKATLQQCHTWTCPPARM